MESKQALSRAIEAAGGQTALADKIGVNQCVVWYWLHKSKRGVSAEYCNAVETVTGVPAYELRPDVFSAPEQEGAS